MRNARFCAAVAGSALVLLAMACFSQGDEPQANQDIPEIVKEAEFALRSTDAAYNAGQATVEDMYRWSRRLMEAELANGSNKKAALDHVSRMRDLNTKVEALFKIGAKGGAENHLHATRYYLLEAQTEALKQAK
jgi:Skp family chaperone for outer membrane proteins